ncbi:MAG: hypothetical protein IJ229_04080 [Clostridia bacterium]|nr:hypothetical protein [Clostridia bacterium]
MKYVIVILIVLAVSFFFGMVLGMIASEEEADAIDDKEQQEYLRKWAEKHRKKP